MRKGTKTLYGSVILISFATTLIATPAYADSNLLESNFKIKAVNTKYGQTRILTGAKNTNDGGNSGGNENENENENGNDGGGKEEENTNPPESKEPQMTFTIGVENASKTGYTKAAVAACQSDETVLYLDNVEGDLHFISPEGEKQEVSSGANLIAGYGKWSLTGGTFESFGSPVLSDHDISCMTEVTSWRNTGTISLDNAFRDHAALTRVAEIPTTVKDLSNAFTYGTGNPDLSKLDTSNVENMERIFYASTNFNSDISKWNVSKVNNMTYAFARATSFNQELNEWKTLGSPNMSYMFFEASSFNKPLNKWNVTSVNNMRAMFNKATSFNQNLNDWDTSNVTDMFSMFKEASAFNNGGMSLNNWETSKVTLIASMFADATNFNQNISSWKLDGVKDINKMFNNASSFNQNLSGWDLSKVTKSDNYDTGATQWQTNYKPKF